MHLMNNILSRYVVETRKLMESITHPRRYTNCYVDYYAMWEILIPTAPKITTILSLFTQRWILYFHNLHSYGLLGCGI